MNNSTIDEFMNRINPIRRRLPFMNEIIFTDDLCEFRFTIRGNVSSFYRDINPLTLSNHLDELFCDFISTAMEEFIFNLLEYSPYYAISVSID